jgi:hypothetical protein
MPLETPLALLHKVKEKGDFYDPLAQETATKSPEKGTSYTQMGKSAGCVQSAAVPTVLYVHYGIF